jgi:hypothetical protein
MRRMAQRYRNSIISTVSVSSIYLSNASSVRVGLWSASRRVMGRWFLQRAAGHVDGFDLTSFPFRSTSDRDLALWPSARSTGADLSVLIRKPQRPESNTKIILNWERRVSCGTEIQQGLSIISDRSSETLSAQKRSTSSITAFEMDAAFPARD